MRSKLRMDISVITLTYNNHNQLENTIKSYYSQLIDDSISIEYLIVDDGSSSFDINYIHGLISKYKKNTCEANLILNSVNLGTVASLNNAIKIAEGEIIILLSADDEFYDENSVMNIYHAFKKEEVNILISQAQKFDRATNKSLEFFPPVKHKYLFRDGKQRELLNHILSKGNILSGAATSYRKSFIISNGMFDEKYRLLEDLPFFYKCLRNNERVYFSEKMGIKYTIGGISTNKKKINIILEKDFDNFFSNVINDELIPKKIRDYIFYKRFVHFKNKLKLKTIFRYPCETLFYAFDVIRRRRKFW